MRVHIPIRNNYDVNCKQVTNQERMLYIASIPYSLMVLVDMAPCDARERQPTRSIFKFLVPIFGCRLLIYTRLSRVTVWKIHLRPLLPGPRSIAMYITR